MLIRWTVRIAVACYVLRLMLDITGLKSDRQLRTTRAWWTIGCLSFVLHVAAAFHFQYRWSHTIAFDYTARRTAELTGWSSGAGLYINEAFLCLWLADTVFWWRNLHWPQNRRWYWALQAIFGFLMIQATVVFGPPYWKIVVPAVLVGLAIQFERYRAMKRAVQSHAIAAQEFVD